MRLVALSRAPEGAELARDVRTGAPGDVPLLRAGTLLTAQYRTRLLELGLRAVWVEDALSEGIEALPPLEDDAREEAERRVGSVILDATDAFRAGRPLPGIATDQL